jgi:cytochrome P450
MVVDVWREMLALTQQIMLRALLGPETVAEEAAFGEAVALRRRYIEYFFTSNVPAAEHLPLPIVFEYRRARRTFDRVLFREIQRRRLQPTGNDWLSMLVHAEGRDGVRFTDAQVRDEAMTLTSTGYETVAAALCWSLHLLAHHPSVQQELAVEGWLADSPNGHPTLLSHVLDEAMRLYPPTWLYVRVATTANTLPSGYPVAVGTKVYLSPYTMHRHPAWYDQPEQFTPRRMAISDAAPRPRFTYFPFGGGARQCIGEPFARMEAHQVLRSVLPAFALVPRTARTVPLRASIVLEPRGGLPLELRSRTAR